MKDISRGIEYHRILGRRMRNIRIILGLRPMHIAKAINGIGIYKDLGVSFMAASNYERGKRKIQLQCAEAIADLFGVSVDFLLGRLGINYSDREVRIQDAVSSLEKIDLVSEEIK